MKWDWGLDLSSFNPIYALPFMSLWHSISRFQSLNIGHKMEYETIKPESRTPGNKAQFPAQSVYKNMTWPCSLHLSELEGTSEQNRPTAVLCTYGHIARTEIHGTPSNEHCQMICSSATISLFRDEFQECASIIAIQWCLKPSHPLTVIRHSHTWSSVLQTTASVHYTMPVPDSCVHKLLPVNTHVTTRIWQRIS